MATAGAMATEPAHLGLKTKRVIEAWEPTRFGSADLVEEIPLRWSQIAETRRGKPTYEVRDADGTDARSQILANPLPETPNRTASFIMGTDHTRSYSS